MVPTYLPATRYGGPIYSVHGLCKGLVSLGHDVHVFTTNVDGKKDSDVPLQQPVELDGVKVWYFPSTLLRRLYWAPKMFKALQNHIREFDVIHLHSVFLWPTWAAARVARRHKKPYFLSPRGMLVKGLIEQKSRLLKSMWIRLIESRNIRNAQSIHLTSQVEMDELKKFDFRLQDYVVIPNGVETPKYLDYQKVSDDVKSLIQSPYILYLGRINWKKGLDRLVDAVSGIDGCRTLIVGNDEEDYLPKLQNLIEHSGAKEEIEILPRFVSGMDKEALLRNATLFVLPSYSENFGNTVVEAMARRCAVIVTEEVGAAEIVRQSEAGFICSANDLEQTLKECLNNNEVRKHCANSGEKWARDHLSWHTVAQRMVDKYEELIVNSSRLDEALER